MTPSQHKQQQHHQIWPHHDSKSQTTLWIHKLQHFVKFHELQHFVNWVREISRTAAVRELILYVTNRNVRPLLLTLNIKVEQGTNLMSLFKTVELP